MGDRPRMGRPPLAEVETLRGRAIGVIVEHGYDRVSMARIAEEVGLSVRTLHRYFPAKADIVWGSVDASFDTIRAALAEAPFDQPIADAVADAMDAAFTAGAEDLPLVRERIRLIATTPALQSIRSETFEKWRTELVVFIAARLGELAEGVIATATAAALQSTMMSALAWWASRDEAEEPRDCVTAALRGLGVLTASSR